MRKTSRHGAGQPGARFSFFPAGTGTPNPVARYDAAGTGRRMSGWNAPASGPNRANEGSVTVRNRARDAGRNEWAAASALRTLVGNLIGTGIIARSRSGDPQQKARHTALWDAWCAVSDADGQLDFHGQQSAAVRAWLLSGEVFIRLRERRPQDNLPVPLQLQLIEADCVPLLDADVWPGMPRGNRICQGIELDQTGRRVAYWIHRSHPGERTLQANAGELSRIPAGSILHLYEPSRPGQMRGISEFAPVLAKLRAVMNFDDAVLHRQEIANLFSMIVTRQATPTAIRGTPASAAPPVATMMPGATIELDAGQDVKFPVPPGAGADYAAFMRHQHLGIAAGIGIPYELLTGDLADVSDRTLRVAINDFRRYCEQRQWQVIIPMLCRPVRAAWVNAAIMGGMLPRNQAEIDAALEVTWSPQRWQYIHPVQDVTAALKEYEGGIRSRSSIIAERGDDPDEIDRERTADREREIALGLAYPEPDPNEPPAPSPQEEAAAGRARAEAELLQAQRDEANARAAGARLRAEAEHAGLLAAARQADAEADLKAAQARTADAQAIVLQRTAERDDADAVARQADREAKRRLEAQESAGRLAAIIASADEAKRESAIRAQALEQAEAAAAERRDLQLAAERARAATAALELEAARIGIAELQGEG